MGDATLDEFCNCGAPAADCPGFGPDHNTRIVEHMARQSEDAILARVLRRFLAPDTHPVKHPYVGIEDEDLTLDGHVDLVPGDADVLRRVAESVDSAAEDRPPNTESFSELARLRALLRRWRDDPDAYPADSTLDDDTMEAVGPRDPQP